VSTDEPDDDMAGEQAADDTTAVLCPYCGAPNEIALDVSGGAAQDYIEDCQVCCRPWNVRVRWRRDGHADVSIEADDATS
jgi:hypothetical protein